MREALSIRVHSVVSAELKVSRLCIFFRNPAVRELEHSPVAKKRVDGGQNRMGEIARTSRQTKSVGVRDIAGATSLTTFS